MRLSSTDHMEGRMFAADESDRKALCEQYDAVRQATETLCEPLVTEDYML